MVGFAGRFVDMVHDSAEMLGCHVRRIAGVSTAAVVGLVDELGGLVWDCGDVVRTGLQPRPDEFELRADIGSIDLDPTDGGERAHRRR